MRTLLVEDDSTTRRMLSELLGANGHDVTEVADVTSGLEEHRRAPFPLIVTDWLMPGGEEDGLDLCRTVRSGPEGSDVFLLVITVRDRASDLEEVLDAGADDYLPKPVDPATLRVRLRVARERITLRQDRREADERFRRFSEAAFEGIVVAQGDTILDANDQFARILGYPLGEMRSLSLKDFIHPDDFGEATAFARSLSEEPFHHRAVRRDGTSIPVEVRIRPMRLRGQDVVVAAVQDITFREQAASERAALMERLQRAQRLESLGVLAGGIAHDFNNLLMGVLGNASLARLEMGDDAPASEYVARIEESANKAADLTSQMLAFSGRGKFVVKPVDLSELIANAENELAEWAAGASITLKLSAGMPKVDADTAQVRQVIHSLVANASESYRTGGGEIVISAGVRRIDGNTLERASVAAGDAFDGDGVFIDVEDRGNGMDAKMVSRIFDPFFSTKFAGRGLGLAAVMGIIRGHGGCIAINSAPGKGTTVSVYFPVAREEAPVEVANHDRPVPNGPPIVLVIDDEPGVRDVTRVMLEKHGFRVITADTGGAGVEQFRREKESVSVTLLDLTMPDMSGAAVFRKIKAVDPGARIVLMSGYNEDDATKEFTKAGLAGFLHKPFAASTLADKINEVVMGAPVV